MKPPFVNRPSEAGSGSGQSDAPRSGKEGPNSTLAEGALGMMSRRLIEAQEQERTRIARELHDDTGQQIALLLIELERFEESLPESAGTARDNIHQIIRRLSDIGTGIQALSHSLHSSKLEYLGIVAAAKSLCRELSERYKVEIDFSDEGIAGTIPNDISLCLFRILQEALQNALKHSGVQHFRVELHGTLDEIKLTVSDHGMGFDEQVAVSCGGLGLISMRERVRLVNGELLVESASGLGTTIHARVPLKAQEREAGSKE
jgi:signal transduction histidine kinase